MIRKLGYHDDYLPLCNLIRGDTTVTISERTTTRKANLFQHSLSVIGPAKVVDGSATRINYPSRSYPQLTTDGCKTEAA